MLQTQNDAFFAMLHDTVTRRLAEVGVDPEYHGFGNVLGEICQQITNEIPIENLDERITQLCWEMKRRMVS